MHRTSDFPLTVQLPASKQCFTVYVMSGREKTLTAEACENLRARSIMLTSEAWKMIKGDIQANCQFAECRQIEGAADGLFLTIDRVLDQMPY